MKFPALLAILPAAIATATHAEIFVPPKPAQPYAPGQILVTPRNGVNLDLLKSWLSEQGLTVNACIDGLRLCRVNVESGKEKTWVRNLTGHPFIDKAELNLIRQAESVSHDLGAVDKSMGFDDDLNEAANRKPLPDVTYCDADGFVYDAASGATQEKHQTDCIMPLGRAHGDIAAAQNLGVTGAGVRVGIVDTGVNMALYPKGPWAACARRAWWG